MNNIEISNAIEQLSCFLGLYAPAPEFSPKDWFFNGDKNIKAWHDYLIKCQERGYYDVPISQECISVEENSKKIEAMLAEINKLPKYAAKFKNGDMAITVNLGDILTIVRKYTKEQDYETE